MFLSYVSGMIFGDLPLSDVMTEPCKPYDLSICRAL